jgi:hypothetical protein
LPLDFIDWYFEADSDVSKKLLYQRRVCGSDLCARISVCTVIKLYGRISELNFAKRRNVYQVVSCLQTPKHRRRLAGAGTELHQIANREKRFGERIIYRTAEVVVVARAKDLARGFPAAETIVKNMLFSGVRSQLGIAKNAV